MRLPGKNAARYRHVMYFVESHLGKGIFAPFTGQDWPAWQAFVYLVECWCAGGGEDAIAAMRMTVRCAQPKESILRCFAQAIPAVGDWPHVAQIWPRIAEGLQVIDRDDAREICAVERGEDRSWLHGWRAPSTAKMHHPTIKAVP